MSRWWYLWLDSIVVSPNTNQKHYRWVNAICLRHSCQHCYFLLGTRATRHTAFYGALIVGFGITRTMVFITSLQKQYYLNVTIPVLCLDPCSHLLPPSPSLRGFLFPTPRPAVTSALNIHRLSVHRSFLTGKSNKMFSLIVNSKEAHRSISCIEYRPLRCRCD